MKKITITFALLLVVLALSGGAAELDPSTGQPATSYVSGFRADPAGGNVLWDKTKGVYGGYAPGGRYSMVTTSLSDAGFVINTTTAGVNNIDLSAYDIVVICLGSAWYYSYSISEVATLMEFQAAGGGILVMSENNLCPTENLDPLLSAFGVTSGHSTIDPINLYCSDFHGHPIYNGIQSIFFVAAGELGASLPAIEAAWTTEDEPVVGMIEDCSLIVVGDMNFIDNDRLMMADNEALILNIFQCLGGSGPVDTEKTTLEGVKSLYR